MALKRKPLRFIRKKLIFSEKKFILGSNWEEKKRLKFLCYDFHRLQCFSKAYKWQKRPSPSIRIINTSNQTLKILIAIKIQFYNLRQGGND